MGLILLLQKKLKITHFKNSTGCSAVTSHHTPRHFTSWLKSRKMKWILHELSVGLCDLHTEAEAAVQWHHLLNLHLWECSRFIKGNHSANKHAPGVFFLLLMKNWNKLPISFYCQCKCKSIRYAAITVKSHETSAPSIIPGNTGAGKCSFDISSICFDLH